ncbi:MAG: hypothetical protein KF873_12125 [Gemmataceae bacterium]|nr:hypothetical protein [Gemmataceae bacterium]
MTVGHLADGASAAVIAGATSEAAVSGFELARRDRGLSRVVFLLARTALAARDADFSAALSRISIHVPQSPGLLDLTSGFAASLQSWHSQNRILRTDLGLIGEQAATESIVRCVGDRSLSLFPSPDAVQDGLRTLSTPKGFSTLAHEFFSRFTQRFLHYHLDRELSQHAGHNGRFPDRKDRRDFVRDLEIHCREAAEITRTYASDWYSKSNFTAGISERQAQTFTTACMKKLRDELAIRGQLSA